VTSLVALKQATYVREDYPDTGKAYVFYQHMRTPGLQENFYKSIQQDPGIFLTKGEVVGVSKTVPAWWSMPGTPSWVKTSRSKPIWWCWGPVWCRPQKRSRHQPGLPPGTVFPG
jgi:hypothetical protein